VDSIASLRRVAVVLLLVGRTVYGQSSLPATSPTSTVAPVAGGAPVPDTSAGIANPASEVKPPVAAKVSYSDGQLVVRANDSSLNQILREISRQTGMKITGGVNDERVFGSYGPSAVDAVLTSLLAGTGSNMMLTANSANGPGELILTPRMGGPTPPNPGAPGFEDDAATDEALRPPTPVRPVSPPMPRLPFGPPPAGAVLSNGGAAPATTSTSATPATGAGTPDATAPQSPNGVKTPEQIYQQLQELQRQKQTQQPNNSQ
jgi:hypothetical protein